MDKIIAKSLKQNLRKRMTTAFDLAAFLGFPLSNPGISIKRPPSLPFPRVVVRLYSSA